MQLRIEQRNPRSIVRDDIDLEHPDLRGIRHALPVPALENQHEGNNRVSHIKVDTRVVRRECHHSVDFVDVQLQHVLLTDEIALIHRQLLKLILSSM